MNTIYGELQLAAEFAHRLGQRDRAAALDRCVILLGSANRMWTDNPDREAFRLLHTTVTEALLLLDVEKPRIVA